MNGLNQLCAAINEVDKEVDRWDNHQTVQFNGLKLDGVEEDYTVMETVIDDDREIDAMFDCITACDNLIADKSMDTKHFDQVHACAMCVRASNIVSDMRDYIVEQTKDGFYNHPIVVFPPRITKFFNLKSEIRLYRTHIFDRTIPEQNCKCIISPAFHRTTGKCSQLVIALSLAYHTSNMLNPRADRDDIVNTLETNFENWRVDVISRRPSKNKDQALIKLDRYEDVLNYNRHMYRSSSSS
jgi:hypothetical protein